MIQMNKQTVRHIVRRLKIKTQQYSMVSLSVYLATEHSLL